MQAPMSRRDRARISAAIGAQKRRDRRCAVVSMHQRRVSPVPPVTPAVAAGGPVVRLFAPMQASVDIAREWRGGNKEADQTAI